MYSRAFKFFRALRVSAIGPMGLLFGVVASSRSADQVERVEFRPWMAEQLGEVRQSFAVLQAKGFPAVPDRPVLPLFAKNSLLNGKDGSCWTRERGGNEFRRTGLTWHKVPHYPE